MCTLLLLLLLLLPFTLHIMCNFVKLSLHCAMLPGQHCLCCDLWTPQKLAQQC